jgi:hypothetical protein
MVNLQQKNGCGEGPLNRIIDEKRKLVRNI